MITLIDPPVGAYSPPDEILRWIEKLRSLASTPEFRDHPENRRQLDTAITDAERFLESSRALEQRPSHRPAI